MLVSGSLASVTRKPLMVPNHRLAVREGDHVLFGPLLVEGPPSYLGTDGTTRLGSIRPRLTEQRLVGGRTRSRRVRGDRTTTATG
jgi:hypothetical protein